MEDKEYEILEDGNKLRKESSIVRDTDFKIQEEYYTQYGNEIESLKRKYNNVSKFNSLIVCWYHNNQSNPVKWTYDLYVFYSNKKTKFTGYNASLYSDARMSMEGFDLIDKESGHIRVTVKASGRTGGQDINVDQPLIVTYFDSGATYTNREYPPGYNMGEPWLMFSSLNDYKRPEFVGYYPNHGFVKEFVTLIRRKFNIEKIDGEPEIPWPTVPIDPPVPEENDTSKSCSNTGQFGGGGKSLKDIKLFLYANKVTKGTVTLRRPQVEVGTYATDWRPNPTDATKSIEMMLKQIESERKGGKKNGKKRD